MTSQCPNIFLAHTHTHTPRFCLIFISAVEWTPYFRFKAAHPGISNQPVTWRIDNWHTLTLMPLNGFSSQQDNYIDRGLELQKLDCGCVKCVSKL